MSLKTVTALLLCLLMASPTEAAKAILHDKGGGLKILVLAGADAVNYIPSRISVTPIVEIRDDNDRPVENVTVKFALNTNGPGADFGDKKNVLETTTNAQGQVAAAGYQANETAGSFIVAVSAASGQRWGAAEIRQTNVLKEAPAPKQGKTGDGGSLKWILLGAAGAAGIAAAVILATRGGDAAAAGTVAAPIGVSTGPITVGAPK